MTVCQILRILALLASFFRACGVSELLQSESRLAEENGITIESEAATAKEIFVKPFDWLSVFYLPEEHIRIIFSDYMPEMNILLLMFTCKLILKRIVQHKIFQIYLARKYRIDSLLTIDYHPQLLAIEKLPYFILDSSSAYRTGFPPHSDLVVTEEKSFDEVILSLQKAFIQNVFFHGLLCLKKSFP